MNRFITSVRSILLVSALFGFFVAFERSSVQAHSASPRTPHPVPCNSTDQNQVVVWQEEANGPVCLDLHDSPTPFLADVWKISVGRAVEADLTYANSNDKVGPGQEKTLNPAIDATIVIHSVN